MKTIRAFIAVALPDEAKEALGRTSAALDRRLPAQSVRWVRPDRMHVTLRFLGDTAVAQLPAIAAELDRLAAAHDPFDLFLAGLGCFPNPKRPRVIWVGLDGEKVRLQALKRGLDERLAALDWERGNRPFQPHLTLGRVKAWQRGTAIDWGIEVEQVAVPVTAVRLIESRLHPQGPEYVIQHTSRLHR